jgi:hypothetical protein
VEHEEERRRRGKREEEEGRAVGRQSSWEGQSSWEAEQLGGRAVGRVSVGRVIACQSKDTPPHKHTCTLTALVGVHVFLAIVRIHHPISK